MSIDPYAFNISISRRDIDGEVLFQATIKELPDVCEFGESADEAYALAVDTIETAYKASVEEGWDFPAPERIGDEFSGRVTLRMPKSLHREVASRASAENTSVNSWICNTLSRASGLWAPSAARVEALPLHFSKHLKLLSDPPESRKLLTYFLSSWAGREGGASESESEYTLKEMIPANRNSPVIFHQAGTFLKGYTDCKRAN